MTKCLNYHQNRGNVMLLLKTVLLIPAVVGVLLLNVALTLVQRWLCGYNFDCGTAQRSLLCVWQSDALPSHSTTQKPPSNK
jgi:hypothetical protein